MKTLLFVLSFIGSAALACGGMGNGPMQCGQMNNPSAGCSMEKGCGCSMGTPILETVTYALGELNLKDNPDIRLAIKLYKKDMRSLRPQIPTDAFANGTFNADLYAQNATPSKALKAQTDLFETIYMVLSDEEKIKFPQLMSMYQHHMSFINVPKMCNNKPMMGAMGSAGCGMHQPLNCGAQTCPMPMKKMPVKKIPATK